MTTIAESVLGRNNTCPKCGHYLSSHNETGCSVMENKYERVNGINEYRGCGPCDCKETNDR